LQGLQQLGWTDGGNAQVDTRWTGGDPERIRTSRRLNWPRSGSTSYAF
jgi:hypothetical protein